MLMRMSGHKWRDLARKMDLLEMDMWQFGGAELQRLLALATASLARDCASNSRKFIFL